MEKPDYLPFASIDEVDTNKALEACEYLAYFEDKRGEYLGSLEIQSQLASSDIKSPKSIDKIIRRVGILASEAMGPVKYKSSKELAQKINRRRNDLNLL